MLQDWEEHKLIEERLEAIIRAPESDLGAIVDHVLSSPGKRVRPLILLFSSEAFGCEPEVALDAALAVELAHAASLVHDDILDGGVERRGAPSTVQRYGMEAALLCGDYLISKSIDMISPYGEEAIRTFSRACMEMAEGELLDLSRISSADDYYRCVSLKTASLFVASAKIGCMVARAGRDDVLCYEQYGLNLGLAYQIVDDLEEALGVDQGKRSLKASVTLPRIHGMERSSEGAVDLCIRTIERHATLAKESLMGAGGSEIMKERLTWIVDQMTRGCGDQCRLLKNLC